MFIVIWSCNEDTFATVLFNDEVHTYEEVCMHPHTENHFLQ